MKLSALVHYRNLLKGSTPVDGTTVVHTQAGHALHLVENHELQFFDLTDQLNRDYHNIIQSFFKFSNTIDQIQEKITALINDIEPEYFAESYRVYKAAYDSVDLILERKILLDNDSADYVHARIKLYGSRAYPGLVIRPALDPWIKDLVGCDPLYLVDQDFELLRPVTEQFHEQYQARLRTYCINDCIESPMLQLLPENQFGFCLVYNFFNYKPLEMVKLFLAELFNKLRPGGTLAFTFNNCSNRDSIELVEQKYMSYTPGHLVFDFCQTTGYNVVQTRQLNTSTTWVELRKPGALSSLRGGQSLARIVAKSK